MRKIIFIFALLLLISNSYAETLIYDNISSSQYKTLRINDDINIKYLNEYQYDIYINDSFIGTYKKDDLIFIPDNSNVLIFIPKNIDTNFNNQYDIGKTYLTIAVMYFLGVGIVILLIVIFIKKMLKRR